MATEKDINKMTNKELGEFCKDNNIKVDSKNVSKPTKDEYIRAITEALNTAKPGIATDEDVINEGITENMLDDVDEFLNVEDDTTDEKVTNEKKASAETRAQKRKRQWNELMKLQRVIITSNSNNQTTLPNQVHYCTWGNRLLGHHTDRFIVGKPWHVREGALRNLARMEISNSIQDEEGNTVRFERVPAFVIQRLDHLSDEERAVIAKRQIIRDSSIESLI